MFQVSNPFLISWFTKYSGIAWLWNYNRELPCFGFGFGFFLVVCLLFLVGLFCYWLVGFSKVCHTIQVWVGSTAPLVCVHGVLCLFCRDVYAHVRIFVYPGESMPALHMWNVEIGKVRMGLRAVSSRFMPLISLHFCRGEWSSVLSLCWC